MYHPEQSLGQIWQPRHVDWTPIDWRVRYIEGYIESGTCGYDKVKLMHFHYNYPHYYLPSRTESRQQEGGRKEDPSEANGNASSGAHKIAPSGTLGII